MRAALALRQHGREQWRHGDDADPARRGPRDAARLGRSAANRGEAVLGREGLLMMPPTPAQPGMSAADLDAWCIAFEAKLADTLALLDELAALGARVRAQQEGASWQR